MTPAEYLAALETLGMSAKGFAEACGIPVPTARCWITRGTPIPAPQADWLRRHVAIRLADPAPKR